VDDVDIESFMVLWKLDSSSNPSFSAITLSLVSIRASNSLYIGVQIRSCVS